MGRHNLKLAEEIIWMNLAYVYGMRIYPMHKQDSSLYKPRKPDIVPLCWLNVNPPSHTVDQH